MSARLACRTSGALAAAAGAWIAALALAPAAAAGDARALTDEGHVLTVGNWALVETDDADVRVADDRFLGWELRDGDGFLVAQGAVPGTDGLGIDGQPALSRSPLTGEVWLAWSRQATPSDVAEIVVQRFGAGSWIAGSLLTVASDVDDQLSPALVVDEAGTAWIAWVDGPLERAVRATSVTADGRPLSQRDLSGGVSTWNGAPTLGIDTLGRIFVAHAGTPVAGGDVTLFIWTPNARPVGASHIPDPFIELGLRGSLPAPSLGRTPTAPLPVPATVHLTVLGGTPVAWWTETENGRDIRFRHAAEVDGSWANAQIRTLDLRSGMVASVPEALELVEARMRRVVAESPGAEVPIVPPGSGGLGRIQTRR